MYRHNFETRPESVIIAFVAARPSKMIRHERQHCIEASCFLGMSGLNKLNADVGAVLAVS
jgi:hypothetical protein